MNSKSHHLVDTYIEKQRRRLTLLRAALVSAADFGSGTGWDVPMTGAVA
jgi:hypothetical protein